MLEYRKSKYQKIRDKVESEYTKKINELDRLLRVIENGEIKEDDPLETIVFKKYIEFENVKDVADSINELGYRIKTNSHVGSRKYTSKDISDILNNDSVEVEEELRESALTMFAYNSERVYKKFC
ncbi:hypothetical protein FDB40_17225 [Clostridium botulinum]|nr:hypothetical protein [Clostridium botulinum]